MRSTNFAASAIVLALGFSVFPTLSHATTVTYVQASQATTCCGIDTNNTVQVSDTVSPTNLTPLATGVFDVLVTLDAGWKFMTDPTGNGHDATLGFASSSNALTFTTIVPVSNFSANVQNLTLGSLKLAPYTWDTAGNFGDGLSIAGNGPSAYSVLDFTVDTHSTDTLNQFLATLLASSDGTNSIFAADVSSAITGKTGAIGFILSQGGHQNETPLPAAVWLMGTVLGGGAGFGAWRKRKKAANA